MGVGPRRRGPVRLGMLVGSSLATLALALGPVAAQTVPARSPSTVDVFGVPLTASQFDTPEYRADWGLQAINAATAYARGFTGSGVIVAVIDTGIYASHPEFIGQLSDRSRSFLPGIDPSRLTDPDGHGTHVSGTVAAARNGIGMMGVAFDSTLIALPSTLGAHDVPAAIDYAAANGARVLNGSYGVNFWAIQDSVPNQQYWYDAQRVQYEAIKRGAAKDMLFVFAAGNDRESQPGTAQSPSDSALLPFIRPENAASGVYQFYDRAISKAVLVGHDPQSGEAIYVHVLNPDRKKIDQSNVDFSSVSGYIVAVVNVDKNYNIATTSNLCGVAAQWCLAAPGEDIYSTKKGGGYETMSGTSMAAPHVTGAAAVLRQALPFLTAPQIAQTMFTTATHLGDGPANAPNAVYGWGLLNLGKAIDGPGQFTADWTVNTTYKDQAYYGRFTNDIAGVGGLTKIGLGTLELAGRDTYAGPTNVVGGTLILSANGSLTSPVFVQGAGTYINAGWTQSGVSNGGLLINAGTVSGGVANGGLAFNTGTIAGGATNTGTLATSGTIGGGLTNAGTVLASAGRIDGGVANNAGLLAVSGAVASNGTFANAAGAILAVTGGGSYSLAGPLTNAGLVTVSRTASLTASAGLSNAGLVASDGTLTTDLTNTGIARLSGRFNGTLTNTGLLQITGPLVGLTGLTTTGGLDLGGTAFTLGSLTGSADAVLGNGAITVAGATNSTYAGAILETASPTSLTKAGTGTLTLTGLGCFSGPTTIQAGTLSLNGFWTSPVTVAAAGTLRGIGTIAAPITVAGALRPGNSPGTLTVLGPVVFNPGSSLGLDIDGPGTGTGAGSYARLLAQGSTGTVAANGTLVPVLRGITGSAGNSFTPALGQRFGVLTAQAGLSGTFTGLAQPVAGLAAGTRFDALYAATGLDLVVTPAAYGNLAGLGLAQTGNARAVGATLDVARPAAGTRPDAARARVYDPLYGASPATLPGSLASLSGQSYGDAVMTDLAARRLLADTIDRHQRGLGGGATAFNAGNPGLGPNHTALEVRGGAGAADRPLAVGEGRVWAEALYGFGARAGDRAASGAGFDAGGLLLGIDRQVGADTQVGGAFSYLRAGGTSRGAGLGRFTTDSYGGTLYASARLGAVVLRGTAGVSYADGRIARTVALGSAVSQASGLSSGWNGGVSGFAGYALSTALPVEIVPEVGFSYDRLTRGRVAERGGLVNQGFGAQSLGGQGLGGQGFAVADLDAARSLVGGRVTSVALADLPDLRLEGRAYWAHELADTAALVRSNLFGAAFSTRTSALGRDGAVLGVNLTGAVAAGVQLSLGYTGDVRKGATAQVFSAGLQVAW